VIYLESIRNSLHQALEHDERVIILGEDIVDPYGGAFKATKGLSTAFPNRVLSTPISEGAIVGLCTGLAIRGFLPVAEIMFGDFLTLCADQLINTASKFPLMYQGKVQVPLVIRATAGGGRGYGPTHSQCMEKLFMGVPGLKVVCPSLYHNPGELLLDCILREKDPVLFIEYKGLYPQEIKSHQASILTGPAGNIYPVVKVQNYQSGSPDVVVLTYGGPSLIIHDILEELREDEINIKALCVSHVNRLAPEEILPEFDDCTKIIIIEETTEGFGWSSQMCTFIYSHLIGRMTTPIRVISAGCGVIPAAKHLEAGFLPSKDKLINSIIEALK